MIGTEYLSMTVTDCNIISTKFDLPFNYFNTLNHTSPEKHSYIMSFDTNQINSISKAIKHIEFLYANAIRHYQSFTTDVLYGKWLYENNLTKSKDKAVGRNMSNSLFANQKYKLSPTLKYIKKLEQIAILNENYDIIK
jgi:hypothetical protein